MTGEPDPLVPLQAYLDADGQVVLREVGIRTPPPIVTVLAPTSDDLRVLLGWPSLDLEQQASAMAHIRRAVLIVKTHTRGRGFAGDEMTPALREVVLTMAARSLNNPTSDARVSAGQYAATPGQPDLILAERLVLDEYRRRVA